MKKKTAAILTIVFLYIMTFSFGILWGRMKSGSWNIKDYGYHTSIAVSCWWTVMGGFTTILALVFVGLHFFKKMVEDEKQRIEADNLFNS